jgi:alpha-glucosidase
MRVMVASYPGDRVLIGETYLPNIQELDKWYGGEARNELQLPMDTQVGITNTLNATSWRNRLSEVETQVHGSQPLLVIDNHDNPRMDRYCSVTKGAAPGANCDDIQKMLATVLFMSRDAALFYYGDEIGMSTTPPKRVEDVKDPVGVTGWPKEKGRDGERTPMQWTPGKDAGFSTAAVTWLPIPPSYVTVNVKTETPQPKSMLDYYKRLIELRRTNAAIGSGSMEVLSTAADANVLAFTRTDGASTVLVLCNYSGNPQTFSMEGHGASAKTLTANYDAGAGIKLNVVTLPAYGAFVGEVQ